MEKENKNSYEAFVYRWTNIENGKIYIGKHKGTIDDGYISSGKRFLEIYNNNPSVFKRDILAYGFDSDILKLEQQYIQEQISMYGYENIYNLTTWEHLKGWKRTCLHCGKIVDPRNEEWLKAFNESHFENCKSNPRIKNIRKTVRQENSNIDQLTIPMINKTINKLLDLQRIDFDITRSDLIRELRSKKKKLLNKKEP